MGPNYSISTACATANYCFVAAANHIRNGEADMILAGGSEAPIIPVGLGGFVACRRDAPWPWLRGDIVLSGAGDTRDLPCETRRRRTSVWQQNQPEYYGTASFWVW